MQGSPLSRLLYTQCDIRILPALFLERLEFGNDLRWDPFGKVYRDFKAENVRNRTERESRAGQMERFAALWSLSLPLIPVPRTSQSDFDVCSWFGTLASLVRARSSGHRGQAPVSPCWAHLQIIVQ